MEKMEGSDETGVKRRIQSSFGNCSPSSVVNQGSNHNFNGTNHVLESNYGKRPVGIPPSHPHSHFGAPPPKFGGDGGGQQVGNFNVRPSHSRSLSQPSFLSFDQLPPLSPCMFRDPPTTSCNKMERENDANNMQGLSLPPRRGHRKSSSDIPLGFLPAGKPVQLVMKREDEGKSEMVDDLFSAYMNFEGFNALNSSSMEDKDSRASGTRTNESSENEVESSGISSNSVEMREKGKRSVPGDTALTSRHSRSFSMDSFMGNLNLNDEMSRIPPSPGVCSAQHSRNNSVDGSTSLFRLEFGNGEFSPEEMEKIMANEKLAEVAMVDPKRVKRILANRVSAARSKERKVRYIAELEYKVQTLQTEATSLSVQLTLFQRDSAELATQNNELRFRLQAMEQQAQLRNALNEALGVEVQRLRMAAQMSGICSPQEVIPNNHVFQMQPSQNMHHSQQTQEQAGPTQSQHRQAGQFQRGGDS